MKLSEQVPENIKRLREKAQDRRLIKELTEETAKNAVAVFGEYIEGGKNLRSGYDSQNGKRLREIAIERAKKDGRSIPPHLQL